MKNKTFIILLFVLVSCTQNNDKSSSVKGVYVTTYRKEYSNAMDTMEITPLNEKTNSYTYTRRTGFQRISNGFLGPHQYEIENSTCVYDERTAQLNEQRHGRIYSFSADGNTLVSGNSVYKRIQ